MRAGRTLAVLAAVLALVPACDRETARRPSPPPKATATVVPVVERVSCGRWSPLEDVGPTGGADADVDEVSGLVESRRHPGVLWGILDNGNPRLLFAFGEDGREVGRFELPHADASGRPIENVDWEDIAIGPYAGDADAVWIADIGTYPVVRATLDLYRVREPELDTGRGPRRTVELDPADVRRVTVRYPPGEYVHNAESFFVDPDTGDGFIVTRGLVRRSNRVGVWRAPADALAGGDEVELEKVAEVVGRMDHRHDYGPTAADISPDGEWIAVKRLDEVFMWHRTGTVEETLHPMARAPCTGRTGSGGVPDADDGESFAFDIDATGAVVGMWSTLDTPDHPNPPLHRSSCHPCPSASP